MRIAYLILIIKIFLTHDTSIRNWYVRFENARSLLSITQVGLAQWLERWKAPQATSLTPPPSCIDLIIFTELIRFIH